MFFGDDKDIIIDPDADLQIADDGTVSWDDILDDGDDDLVSLKDSKADTKDVGANEDSLQTVSDNSLIDDVDDELQFADIEEDDDVDDEELQKILTNDSDEAPKQKAFNAFGASNEAAKAEPSAQEDFDIDAQLANAAGSSAGMGYNANSAGRSERSEIKVGAQPNKNNMPFLIAVLVAVLVGGGVYYYTSYYSEDDITAQLPAQQQAVQEQMNNTTQEDIANRTEEGQAENQNIPVVNEEQLVDLQANKDDTQDKKEVVPVIQTGRVDPFLPLGKYTTVVVQNKPKPIVIPQKVVKEEYTVPKPPIVVPDANVAYIPQDLLNSLNKFSVNGIMYDAKNPAAILNYKKTSYFIKLGDKVDNFRVKDIQKNYVVLSYNDRYSYKVPLTENMETKTDYSSEPGFVSINNNKHTYREVYKSKDKETNNDGEYFSSDEVEINERTE